MFFLQNIGVLEVNHPCFFAFLKRHEQIEVGIRPKPFQKPLKMYIFASQETKKSEKNGNSCIGFRRS